MISFCVATYPGLAQDAVNWLNTGDVAFVGSNYQLALDSYNEYIERNPEDPRGYLQRGKLHAAMGHNYKARLDLEMAESLNPLSHMYMDMGLRSNYYAEKFYNYDIENKEAAFSKSPVRVEHYDEYLNKQKSNHEEDGLMIEAINNIRNYKFDAAEIALSEINPNPSNLPIIHDLKGLIYLKKQQLDSAIVHFTEAINLEPSFAIAYHNRAICYKLQNRNSEAKEDISKAIDINDEFPIFFFTFARLHQKLEDFELAKFYYEKAITRDKGYFEAMANYSQLLKGLGDFESSMYLLSEAASWNINDLERKFLMANLQFVYGEYDESVKNYEVYIADFPNDSDAIFNLGLAKLLLREYEEGCEYIQESIELDQNKKRNEIYTSYCSEMF